MLRENNLQEKLEILLRSNLKKPYLKYKNFKRNLELSKYSKLSPKYNKDFNFSESIDYFKTRNEIHLYYHKYYHHKLPREIQEHREYIEKHKKGFGESAFHAMWWKIMLEFKPVNALEIGVYRGQVVSLWTLIAQLNNFKIDVHGISPFSSLGDTVSEYMKNMDYYKDTIETFKDLDLKQPKFIKSLSNNKEAIKHIESKVWDMVYIDGGHDFEDVLFDYKLCHKNLKRGGIIIFDDASLYTDYKPLSFSFAGHPGPSKVAREYADKEMDFIGAVGHNNIYKKR